jgi:hypothetical protein
VEGGWPASTDPTADSIEPPVAGGKTADQVDDPPPQPAPSLSSTRGSLRRSRPGSRAFIWNNKDDLDVPLADDAEVVAHVDEITAVILAASLKALSTDNRQWMMRYRWFAEIVGELGNDPPDKWLDA